MICFTDGTSTASSQTWTETQRQMGIYQALYLGMPVQRSGQGCVVVDRALFLTERIKYECSSTTTWWMERRKLETGVALFPSRRLSNENATGHRGKSPFYRELCKFKRHGMPRWRHAQVQLGVLLPGNIPCMCTGYGISTSTSREILKSICFGTHSH